MPISLDQAGQSRLAGRRSRQHCSSAYSEASLSYNLRYVARHLRYLPLPQLVGEKVTLRSLRTTSDDVITQFGPKLPGLTITPIQGVHYIETQLAKYAFWDSCWQIDGEVEWNREIKGLPLLSSLGYF